MSFAYSAAVVANASEETGACQQLDPALAIVTDHNATYFMQGVVPPAHFRAADSFLAHGNCIAHNRDLLQPQPQMGGIVAFAFEPGASGQGGRLILADEYLTSAASSFWRAAEVAAAIDAKSPWRQPFACVIPATVTYEDSTPIVRFDYERLHCSPVRKALREGPNAPSSTDGLRNRFE